MEPKERPRAVKDSHLIGALTPELGITIHSTRPEKDPGPTFHSPAGAFHVADQTQPQPEAREGEQSNPEKAASWGTELDKDRWKVRGGQWGRSSITPFSLCYDVL